MKKAGRHFVLTGSVEEWPHHGRAYAHTNQRSENENLIHAEVKQSAVKLIALSA